MVDERVGSKINVEVCVGNQRLDHVQRELRLFLGEGGQGEAWGRAHECLHLGSQRGWESGTTAVLIEKDEITDNLWGQFRSRAHPVGEAQAGGGLFARRTAPATALVAHIAMRLGTGQMLERFLGFPLF
jgi:hypothetical protein